MNGKGDLYHNFYLISSSYWLESCSYFLFQNYKPQRLSSLILYLLALDIEKEKKKQIPIVLHLLQLTPQEYISCKQIGLSDLNVSSEHVDHPSLLKLDFDFPSVGELYGIIDSLR